MDKNFINIDDLVRQRLEGGEEQERAGAWLRMSELLEKDMPRVRPAGFFWRRMFGVIAGCALLACISLGGYELSTHRNLGSSNGNNVAVIAANTTAATHAPNVSARDMNEANTTEQNKPANTSAPVAASDNKATAGNNANNSNKHNDNNNNNNNTETHIVNAAPAATVSKTGNNTTDVAVNNDHNTTTNTNPAKQEPKHVKNTTHNKTNADNAVAVNETKPAAAPVVKKEHTQPAKEVVVNNNKPANQNTPAKHTAKKNNSNANAEVAVNKPAPAKHNAQPEAGNKPATHILAANTPVAKENRDNVEMNKLPVGAGAAPGKNGNKPVAHNNNKRNNNRGAAKNGNKTPSEKGKDIAGNNNQPAPVVTPKNEKPLADNGAGKDKPTARKGKRLIDKVVVNEHLVYIAPNKIVRHLDTISMESLTEEYELAGMATKHDAEITPGAATSNGANSNAGADGAAPPVPGAPATDPAKPEVAKEAKGKKSFAGRTMENISEAFNDIKYRAGNVQFAPGLTAGVNGTFFGPSTFKGFQFGLTGTFVFNDAISVVSELKYFHRINNDYTLSDNYYDYTANPAGGYNKQLHLNWYSFSTLHSFEMPLTVKYSSGYFSFYAGGNLVYTFSVNTGAAQIVPGNTTPIVQTPVMSNDNTPQLSSNDFNSRFGLGYVFGLTYQITQKLGLDLREVQTFWDNAKNPGMKKVSGELYKSPSFQLSLTYRLGNTRGKSKE